MVERRGGVGRSIQIRALRDPMGMYARVIVAAMERVAPFVGEDGVALACELAIFGVDAKTGKTHLLPLFQVRLLDRQAAQDRHAEIVRSLVAGLLPEGHTWDLPLRDDVAWARGRRAVVA